MFEWSETTVAVADITDYKLVRGTPSDVEEEVLDLIVEGFTILGEPIEYTIPSTTNTIIIQPMVKYEDVEADD